MPTIEKAGAIIQSQADPDKIALLYRAKQNDWSFPKGHVESGESVAETTIREIQEETGLSVTLIKPLPPMGYIHANGDSIKVHMFLVRSTNDAALKTEFDGDKLIWCTKTEVAEKLSYTNLREYFENITTLPQTID